MLASKLLEILVCPQDRGTLRYFPDLNVLENPRSHLVYDVKQDIAVLLPGSARDATSEERAAMEATVSQAITTGLKHS